MEFADASLTFSVVEETFVLEEGLETDYFEREGETCLVDVLTAGEFYFLAIGGIGEACACFVDGILWWEDGWIPLSGICEVGDVLVE